MSKPDLILLALDDPQIQQLFERALATASYSVAVARDRKALDRVLQESSPALLIIGEKLHDESGLTISAGLLERFPTLPILLFAQEGSPDLLREAIYAGISDILCPPLRIDRIMSTVQNSLKRAQRIGDWTRREVKRTTDTLKRRVGELQILDAVIKHIEEGVIILDESAHIFLINPAARRAFGLWQGEKLAGKSLLDVIPHPDLRELLTTGVNNPLPHNEIVFEDGRVLSARYTSIPEIGAAVTLQDITYLRQLDHLKGEFVHTVSHDLRSPLTAILGYIELLGRVGPLTGKQQEFVHRVQASVQNITALVNDLLELGRVEAGHDSHKEMIPLEGIINYAIDDLRPQAIDKGQELRVEMPPGIPHLLGNPIRLRQMLDNLIGNAIKYTPEAGKILVKVDIQDGQIILRVSDTGPGIPPADQPHVFDKFYRASNVPKGVGGSGLGLAIVKSIVDNHDGRIWVESVLGEGSAFTVVLPVYKPEEVPTPQ